MRQLAHRTLGVPIVAAGSFRTIAEVEPLGSLAGALLSFGQWAWLRKRSRLPLYPFVIITGDELIVLEFRFGSTLSMKRVVGRWSKRDVRVLDASPDHRRAKVVTPLSPSPIEVEGAFGSDDERDVVSQLREMSTGV